MIHFIESGLLVTLCLFSVIDNNFFHDSLTFRKKASNGLVSGFISIPSALLALRSQLFYPSIISSLSLCFIFLFSHNSLPTRNLFLTFTFPPILSFLIHFLLQIPFFPLFIQCYFSHFVLTVLLWKTPKSFSMGEAIIISILSSLPIYLLLSPFENAILFVRLIFVSIGIISLIFSLVFPYPFVPIISLLPLIFVYPYLFDVINFLLDSNRIFLFIYCLFVCVFFILASTYWKGLSSFPITIQRKLFHFMAFFVFVPPAKFDSNWLSFALSLAIFLFLIIESLRITKFPYISNLIEDYVHSFLDKEDSGELILTHIYLLVGCGVPVLISKQNKIGEVIKMCGICILTIGDTFASAIGTKFGKHKWFDTNRSIEGTTAAIISTWFSLFITSLNSGSGLKIFFEMLIPSFLASLDEAFTSQIDNLILPFIFIPFLCLSLYF